MPPLGTPTHPRPANRESKLSMFQPIRPRRPDSASILVAQINSGKKIAASPHNFPRPLARLIGRPPVGPTRPKIAFATLITAACLVLFGGLPAPAQVPAQQRQPTPGGGANLVKPDARTTRQAMREPPASPVDPELIDRLTTTIRTSIDQRPLRETLDQFARLGGYNLWVDRRIDPDQTVSLPAGPKTLFWALDQVATAAGVKVVAIGNLVLVGRPAWVDRLTGLILINGDRFRQFPPATISWPEASTPAEAILAIGPIPEENRKRPKPNDVPPDNDASLPHDLWPATRLQAIPRPLAKLLVESQFEPADDTANASAKARDNNNANARDDERFDEDAAAKRLIVRYPAGPHLAQLREGVAAADPSAAVKPLAARDSVEVIGSSAAHVAAIRALLSRPPSETPPKVDIDRVRFAFNLRGVQAGLAFQNLATAADHTLEVDPAAQAACLQLVMLQAEDKTLRQLVELIAQQVGVRATWGDNRLQISLP